ncbi:MAG TPA: hypothetical protein DEF00_02570 [Candidatus Taylorbacteria bacterium]|nr:MAG: hypothetical protein UY29_C0014G0001 [Parcubacteria group bacterium GW2011_GWC2_48_17]HBV01257.1 hypothetical protein [Candidatus Taylorbacteria bacterium]
MSSSKLEWKAYDKTPKENGPDWYWAVSIIAISIMITAVVLNNILFAVLVVISTIALFLRTLQKPRLVSYELTNRGLWTNKNFQPFTALESFFVEEQEPKLLLKVKGLVTPLSVIPLESVDSQTVREFLQDYLPEEEMHEPLSKRIMEYLGF